MLDFGSSGVGDPACDRVIAWTFLSRGEPELLDRLFEEHGSFGRPPFRP